MRQHSVGYTILFSAAVCVVCSLLVSTLAVSLKGRQEENAILDRQRNVLMAAGLMTAGQRMARQEIIETFEANFEAVIVDMATGEFVADADPALFNRAAALRDPQQSEPAPENQSSIQRVAHQELIYLYKKDDQIEMLVLPIRGMGLWSTLYGFIALSADGQTVQGLTFYEHGETPGLGGEIDNPNWKARWPGRKVFGDDGEVELTVIKGQAGPPEEDPYRVDGIAGATLTVRGVTNLLHFWLGENGFGPLLDRMADNGDNAASNGKEAA